MFTLKKAYAEACAALEEKDFEKANRIFEWMDENPSLEDPSSEIFRRANGFLSWAFLAKIFDPASISIQESLRKKLSLINTETASPHIIADARALQDSIRTANME